VGTGYSVAAKMSAATLNRPDATEKEKQGFQQLTDALEKSLVEIRTISYLLHPPLLDEVGLGSAAKWLVDGFSQRSSIRVNLKVPAQLKRLPAAMELTLFRILQESLTNIHRHSHSSSVDVELEVDGNRIVQKVRTTAKAWIQKCWSDSGPTAQA
jgi:signal transduction histidine kinase